MLDKITRNREKLHENRAKNWKIKHYFSDLMTAGHPVTFNILKGNFVDNFPPPSLSHLLFGSSSFLNVCTHNSY